MGNPWERIYRREKDVTEVARRQHENHQRHSSRDVIIDSFAELRQIRRVNV